VTKLRAMLTPLTVQSNVALPIGGIASVELHYKYLDDNQPTETCGFYKYAMKNMFGVYIKEELKPAYCHCNSVSRCL